ncbi:DUF2510 domain-containing protein [Curtobacterium sp. MCSS17_016]|uniref:DUF2510 domain-containing protein n=1 Tax=Curtobacterium sp. MCSS17_016 TaxID=2175644 RepID=UPI000DA75134|nr:DUF2510 domain-containing protein [Curtobacterium sp. MCSS17_016]WIE81298.1 DUF2510 domain-containing protein [Curtobacterium sp. MCSS17_016]
MTSPAPGWYPDPAGTAQARFWDGAAWTTQTQPFPAPSFSAPAQQQQQQQVAQPTVTTTTSPSASTAKVQRYYLSNLLRWRYWQFTVLGSLVIGVVLTVIFAPLGYLFFVVLPLLAWFWLRVQMVCHNCRRRLAVTKIDGQLEQCSNCYHPTDNALRQAE